MSYGPRFYRNFTPSTRWDSFRVQVESTDLFIRCRGNHALEVQHRVRELRRVITDHMHRQPRFGTALTPIPRRRGVHPMIEAMYRASELAEVGPMAAVAGAVAQWVGRDLEKHSPEVIVENGGDLYLCLREPGVSTLYAGSSKLSGAIGLSLDPVKTPMAICTSSGTVGHSYSQGQTDAATIIARDTPLADAVATGTANRMSSDRDFESALEYALGIQGVLGVVLIHRDQLAAQGDVELVAI